MKPAPVRTVELNWKSMAFMGTTLSAQSAAVSWQFSTMMISG